MDLKDLFPFLHKTPPNFVFTDALLLLTLHLIVPLNMLSKHYSVIGLLNWAPLKISYLIGVLNISIKLWNISVLPPIFNHSPRTPFSPWTNVLVEVQNCYLGAHHRLHLQNSYKLINFKLKCMLMLIKLLHFLNLKLFLNKLFSIHTLVFY